MKQTEVTRHTFYHLDETERMKEQKRRINWIRNKGNPLIKKMNEIVENEVMRFDTDFYIHDLEKLKERGFEGNYMWIVRTHGTFLIDLDVLEFDEDSRDWKPFNFLRIVLKQFSTAKGIFKGKIYLIENGTLQKISTMSAFATMSIYTDIARQKARLNGHMFLDAM